MNVANVVSVESRIRGAIYGALVGDALGVPVEFSLRNDRDVDPVCGMRSDGVWRQLAGTWSDDGALLLCTAEAVVGGFDPELMARLCVSWMTHSHWTARGSVFDIGRTTFEALTRVAEGHRWDIAGATDENSNGNGSLMRILPVALRFRKKGSAALMRYAADASRITHAHPRSQLACGYYCLVVAEVLAGATVAAAMQTTIPILRDAVHALPEDTLTFSREELTFARLLSGELGRAGRDDIKSLGYVMHSLEAALWCALREPTFEDAVLAAVNLGGDTDTTACVAGGLLGALHGYEAIPPEWIAALPRREDVDALLDKFVPACG